MNFISVSGSTTRHVLDPQGPDQRGLAGFPYILKSLFRFRLTGGAGIGLFTGRPSSNPLEWKGTKRRGSEE